MSSRADRIIEKAFLGSEFLTWLWYASEQAEGRFTLEKDQLEVHFEDLLVLESILADSQENTFKGGEPTRSEEARLALRLGKKVSRAKLRLRREEREFAFTLKAANLDLSSIKLPAVLSKVEEEQFYERLYLLEELDRTLQDLYLAFLRRRLSPAWEAEVLPSIRRWISSGPPRESESGEPLPLRSLTEFVPPDFVPPAEESGVQEQEPTAPTRTRRPRKPRAEKGTEQVPTAEEGAEAAPTSPVSSEPELAGAEAEEPIAAPLVVDPDELPPLTDSDFASEFPG